ncbi:uncharacterized protein LOC113147324 [Cyclospora cayetanensis]|uniref:Uncharacterized protein LOC113147324 n=1 Tax=Cyclospora cayetanensis TaxID=88456 RepID=A0A6P6RZD1_9EIME|nr:uncharacterized protein LOC113147324 [Cyclospora cayetanensis]
MESQLEPQSHRANAMPAAQAALATEQNKAAAAAAAIRNSHPSSECAASVLEGGSTSPRSNNNESTGAHAASSSRLSQAVEKIARAMEALAEETAEGIPLAKSTSLPGAERYATQLKVQVPHGVSVLKGSSNSSGLCCCCPSSEVSYLYFAAARLLQHLDASAVVDAARRKRFHRARIAAAEADRAATAPWRYLLSVGSRSLLLLLTEYVFLPFKHAYLQQQPNYHQIFVVQLAGLACLSLRQWSQLQRVITLLHGGLLQVSAAAAADTEIHCLPLAIIELNCCTQPAAGAPEGDAEAADQMLRQLQIFALSLHQTQHVRVYAYGDAPLQEQRQQQQQQLPKQQPRCLLYAGGDVLLEAPPLPPQSLCSKAVALLEQLRQRLLLPMQLRMRYFTRGGSSESSSSDCSTINTARKGDLIESLFYGQRGEAAPPRLLIYGCGRAPSLSGACSSAAGTKAAVEQQQQLPQAGAVHRISPQQLLQHLFTLPEAAGLQLLVLPLAAVVSPYVGDTEQRLTQLFAAAAAASPCVLLLLGVERAAANRSVLSPFPPKLQLQHPPHQQGAAASRKGPPSQGGSSRSTSQRRLLAALLLALDTLEDKRRLQLQQQQSPLHGGLQDTQGTDQQQQPPPLPPQGSVVLPRLGSKEDEKLRRLLGGPCPAAAAGVAIVATTQLLPEELDSAVVRAGRLDSWIPWA